MALPGGAMALYDTSPARSDFFALPWPSDARIATGADGKPHLDLTGFYNPGGEVGKYLTVIARDLDAFGTQSAIYFRFDAPLDVGTLPVSPAASIAPLASAFVVDVTPTSPTYGQRTPMRVRFTADFGNYIGSNSLTLLPEPGFPLRERTTYAAVITDGVVAADGGSVRRDPRFIFNVPATATSVLGVAAEHVVVATSFTTQDATSIMKALRDAVYAQAAAPTVADFKWIEEQKGLYDHYEGTYPSPNFQEGDVPYSTSGGSIHLGADGKPAVVRTEQLRFALTIPKGDMPAAGWPVMLYAHGTGGDFQTFIRDGEAADAAKIVDNAGNRITGLAMISIDQVLHGMRSPNTTDYDSAFYNLFNLPAARDNGKQGGLDDFQLLRFVDGFSERAAPKTGQPIRFDGNRIYFKGHSQGGLTGPLFLAFEPRVKAAVLSGAGANLILALLGKTQPVNVPLLVGAVVGESVDQYHPLLNLVQTYLESTDPGNYARLFFREPPTGQAPKSIFHSLGVVDEFTPIPTIIAFSLAMGTQPAGMQILPIEDLPLTGIAWTLPPVMSNVAAGAATAVLCEYKVPVNSSGKQIYDGHFVVSENPDAIRQSNAFLGTHAISGIATLIQ